MGNKIVTYHDNKKTASSIVHQSINKEVVSISNCFLILGNGKWNLYQMGKIFPLIKEWRVKKLTASKLTHNYIGINVLIF